MFATFDNRFASRNGLEGAHLFEFEVADKQSNAFVAWQNAANTHGHLGVTHGLRPRRYGFY